MLNNQRVSQLSIILYYSHYSSRVNQFNQDLQILNHYVNYVPSIQTLIYPKTWCFSWHFEVDPRCGGACRVRDAKVGWASGDGKSGARDNPPKE